MQSQNKRRQRGDGYLFKRPNAQGGETWIGKFWVGRKQGLPEKQIMRTIGPVKSKKQPDGLTDAGAEHAFAEVRKRAVAELILKAREGESEEAQRGVHDIRDLGRALIAAKEAEGLKRSTLEAYATWLDHHFIDYFGPMDVRDIGRRDVEGLVSALRAKGLAPKSIANALGALSVMMNCALDQDPTWVDANPVGRVRRAKTRTSTDLRVISTEELEAILREVPEDQLGSVEGPLYVAGAMTGLRQGELTGLRWRDVDWTAMRIRVEQSFVRGEFGSPKSGKGRSVPLNSRVAGELERLFQRSQWTGDGDLVFAHPATGRPIDRSKLLKRFKSAVARAGLRPARFHDLRHHFGTRAIAVAPPRTVQEWMGHASIRTTLVYAHYVESPHETAWVEAAFASAIPDTTPVIEEPV